MSNDATQKTPPADAPDFLCSVPMSQEELRALLTRSLLKQSPTELAKLYDECARITASVDYYVSCAHRFLDEMPLNELADTAGTKRLLEAIMLQDAAEMFVDQVRTLFEARCKAQYAAEAPYVVGAEMMMRQQAEKPSEPEPEPELKATIAPEGGYKH